MSFAQAVRTENSTATSSSASGMDRANASTAAAFEEQHYAVAEVAELWNLSTDAVRKLFEQEPDVMVIGDDQPRGKRRRYRTLRIPRSVVERVYRRLCNPCLAELHTRPGGRLP